MNRTLSPLEIDEIHSDIKTAMVCTPLAIGTGALVPLIDKFNSFNTDPTMATFLKGAVVLEAGCLAVAAFCSLANSLGITRGTGSVEPAKELLHDPDCQTV